MGKERNALGIAVMRVDCMQCTLHGKKYEVRLVAQEFDRDLKIDLLFKEDTIEQAKNLLYSLDAVKIQENKVIVVVMEESGNVYALADRKLELFLLVSNERVRLPSDEDVKDLLHEIITQRNDEDIRAKIDALNGQLKRCEDEKQTEQLEKAIKACKRLLKLSDTAEGT